MCFFFFSSRRRHTRFSRDWSSDVCSSDLGGEMGRGDGTLLKGSAAKRARAVPARSGFLSDAMKLLLVAVAYYLAARLSLRLALIQQNVTPLWPPTGIALVAFLVLRRRIWPAIALAAFLVNL